MRYTLVCLFLLVNIGFVQADDKLDKDISVSYMISTPKNYSGSAVSVVRDGKTFLWTAAHVLEGCEHVKEYIDPRSGQKRYKFVYDDVKVIKEIYEDGRKVGETSYFCQIIRLSDIKNGGYDLALLYCRANEFKPPSVTFYNGPLVNNGDPVWHVGSMFGKTGVNSVSDGVVSATGRLRKNFASEELKQPRVYDQISLLAKPGSSGGGVFLKSSGECIGLLTEGMGDSMNWVVPARSVIKYAKSVKAEWAVSDKVKCPTLEEILKTPVSETGVEVTK